MEYTTFIIGEQYITTEGCDLLQVVLSKVYIHYCLNLAKEHVQSIVDREKAARPTAETMNMMLD